MPQIPTRKQMILPPGVPPEMFMGSLYGTHGMMDLERMELTRKTAKFPQTAHALRELWEGVGAPDRPYPPRDLKEVLGAISGPPPGADAQARASYWQILAPMLGLTRPEAILREWVRMGRSRR